MDRNRIIIINHRLMDGQIGLNYGLIPWIYDHRLTFDLIVGYEVARNVTEQGP